MKKKQFSFNFIFLICLFISANSIAQIPVLKLPENNFANADAIIEEEDIKIEIDNKSCKYYIHQTITLLNDNKKELAEFYESYDKNTSIKFIKGVFTNARGEAIKKIKRSDLSDVANMSEFATDMRMLYYELPSNTQFPLTVEYEYEITTNFLLYIPAWHPVPAYGVAVKHSTYSVISENENAIRFLEKNNAPEIKKSVENNKHVYAWELKDFAAVKKESFAPTIDEVTPYVLTAPTNLSYNNYSNQFQNWEDFGSWFAKLNSDRKNIPDALKQKMLAITKEKSSTIEKAKAVYEYMQATTRYVSVQFGIGGFQSMDAERVYKTGYGDCKALTNYMVALLNSINIPAYYTLVKAGEHDNIKKEFPSNQFNHVIACLPNGKDTIWLECTSQKIAFGYLGDFTDDRDVLVIADKPFIAHTKKYSSAENITKTYGTVSINTDGDATCSFTLNQKALNTEYLSGILNYYNTKEQHQKLANYFDFKNIELDSFSFTELKNEIPNLILTAHFFSREYASKTSNRFFIPVNQLNNIGFNLLQDTSRKLPVLEYEDNTLIDSIQFVFPQGYTVESKNNKGVINTIFGYYEYEILVENNTVLYKRKLVTNKGKYEAKQYSELYAFYKEIAVKDALKIILKKLM